MRFPWFVKKDYPKKIVKEAKNQWIDPAPLEKIRADKGWSTSQPDWCGEWVGYVLGKVGLKKEIRKHITPSTYRLASHEFVDEIGWHATELEPPKKIKPPEVAKGDVVSVETSGGKSYGDHIALVYNVLHDKIYTYEGNSRSGITSDLKKPQKRSVIRAVRDISDIRRVYRFTPKYFD